MTRYRLFAKLRQQASATRLMVLGLCAFVAWANLFELDQTVRSSGQVIASARNQIIQAADGGVLTQLMVSEGEHVQAGQIVAQLEISGQLPRSSWKIISFAGGIDSRQCGVERARAEV